MLTGKRDVVIVGAGVSGLTLAWHLHRAGVDVCLLEAADEVGGCTRSELRDGFLLEKGPFNVIVRDPAFEDLLEGLSDQVKVVTADKSARKRYIYRHGRLNLVPTNPISLLTTPLLTFGGRLRLMTGMMLSRRAGEREETIEQVAIRRFGRDVSDSMISAVIAGIFAGDIRKLSLRACFSFVADVDRQARSLIGYGLSRAFARKKKHKRRYKGLVSIDGGLGAMTGAMGKALGDNLLTGTRAESIREVDGGYEIDKTGKDGQTESIRCRRLVLAGSAADTARLLEPVLPDAAGTINTIESTSLVVLNLGFKRSDVGHPLEGYGFLVPHNETQFPLMGVLWADSIFPHHAPEGHRLVRVFIGGAHNPEAVTRSNDELLRTALEGSRDLLAISGDPVLVDVCRYPAAIPQYHLGHAEKIRHLEAVVADKPGLWLAGNYVGGVSLNDCVRFSAELADELTRKNT